MSEVHDPKELVKIPSGYWLWKMFGCIERFPKNATFANQNTNEIIYLTFRRHVIKNLYWIMQILVWALLPFLIWILLGFLPFLSDFRTWTLEMYSKVNNNPFFIMFIMVYYSTLITYGFIKFLDWYYDIDIITNERIISVEFKILSGHSITESPLYDIIDIEEHRYGLAPATFNYGILSYRTSAEHEVIIKDIPTPTYMRDILSDLVKYFREQRYDEHEESPEPAPAKKKKIVNLEP
jgi:hypothetical protein